mmetsp:Transcript_77572/g.225138  ORF Transcript_77572/g.225138 Transcript_77572/m.225138 type:complete len:355 (-) Transcript_77572:45-1109(-)
MKFSTGILTAALMAGSWSSSHAFAPAVVRSATTSTSTELNMFALFKGAGSTKVAPEKAASLESSKKELPILEEKSVQDLFYLWNDALKTLSPKIVAKRYAKNAVLLPTVSDEPRMDKESIEAYFENFLQLKPQGTILLSKVTAGPGWAQDVGLYEFSLNGGSKTVKARYSFVYTFEDNQWKILHHHSSQMPEEVTANDAPKLVDKSQVQNLFHLWNDALDTLDPDAVAARYAKEAVLLPTVSDTPRTDYDSIRDYFVDFLKLEPQGEILESHVTMGPNWAKDVGLYEFTLRASNHQKVKARYSYVYTYEDGQWKILHHHSSKMPEEEAAKLTACEEKVSQLSGDKKDEDDDSKK